jgi:hypothetical protein
MKLITWEWTCPIGYPPMLWLTLWLNTRRGKRQIVRLAYTQGENRWRIQAPRDFGDEPGPYVHLEQLMNMLRDIVAEMLAEEFAGVDR